MNKKFSLILATYNPDPKLLLRLLESLSRQSIKNFELIIVEQTIPPVAKNILENFHYDFDILFFTSKKGLSRSRNLGSTYANGQFLLFPDDDCWYDDDFFHTITKYIDTEKNKILTFRAANDEDINIAKFDTTSGFCDKFNIWKRVSSISLCIEKTTFDSLLGFNENLGLGSGTLTSACEDIELPLRAICNKIDVKYTPTIVARHDIPIKRDPKLVIHRAKNHMFSVGYLYKKYDYPIRFVIFSISKNIVALTLYSIRLNTTMVKYHYYTAIGKFKGYLANTKLNKN
ncbi:MULTISPECIES: glycosyltransferase family 2 protein [Gammaproteobacteria]|uniref:glycosyltransferase family 2 protein n=1 Tax=Gammaproteobacteria TaxID=1236 RepID=UPI0036A8CB11